MLRMYALFSLLALSACDDGGQASPTPGADAAQVDAQPRDAASDSGPRPTPDIDVQPGALTLVAVPGEASPPGEVRVRNTGDARLRLDEIVFEPADARFVLEDLFALPADIAPGEEVAFRVTFRSTGPGEVRTALIIRSQDPDEGQVTVPITAREQQDCLRVSPAMVTLGRVQPGQQSGRFAVTISNCGDVELAITDVRVEGDQGFVWTPPEGREAVGPLSQSGVLSLDIWYVNTQLAPGELTTAHLVVESTATANPRVDVELQARGDDVQGCLPVFEPSRLEFDVVRIGTERTVAVTLKNQGSDACSIRDLSVEPVRGPAANTFRIERGDEVEVPGAGEITFSVVYAPQVADPIGDRAMLHFDYHDTESMENRRASTQLLGVGAEALIGGVPDEVLFHDVTTPGCASKEQGTAATNVGFVPLCVTGFRLEGDTCDEFVLLAEPDFSQCIPLMPDEGVPFPFVFQPAELGERTCSLVVTSDAMNTAELVIPLRGQGVEGPATVDNHVVPRLDAQRRAYFGLSRPAVADSIQVMLNDMPNNRWDFDAESNSIFFEPRNHPQRDDRLRIEYDAVCFDRR